MNGSEFIDPDRMKVDFGSLDRGVPEQAGEVIQIPAVPQIRDGKSVAQSMRAEPHAGNADLPSNHLQIPFKIPHGDAGSVPSSKHQSPRGGMLGCVTIQRLSHLNRKRNKPIFPALPPYLHYKVFKIAEIERQAQKFAYAISPVQD